MRSLGSFLEGEKLRIYARICAAPSNHYYGSELVGRSGEGARHLFERTKVSSLRGRVKLRSSLARYGTLGPQWSRRRPDAPSQSFEYTVEHLTRNFQQCRDLRFSRSNPVTVGAATRIEQGSRANSSADSSLHTAIMFRGCSIFL